MKRYLRRTLKEEISEDDIYDVIYEVINVEGPTRDDVIDITKGVIARVDDYSNEDDIYQALDDELIYDDDQWTIFRYYSDDIESADWQSALENFYTDLVTICDRLHEMFINDTDDDYEDEGEEEE